MKKLLTLVVVALMIMTFAVAANAQDISVTLDGEALVFEQAPVIVEGRTLVPLRAIFEALGASVKWDDATKTVTSVKGDITVRLTIGSTVLYKNNDVVTLDVPAQIVGAGYTMVPARAIAESFGVLVDWDDSTKTVILVNEKKADEPEKTEGADKPDEAVLVVSGETYSNNMGITGKYNDGPKVVNNPDDASDKVLYIEINTEGKAWNYFWYDCAYVPGQRYLISFSAKRGNDCYGDPLEIDSTKLGVNVQINGSAWAQGAYKLPDNSWVDFARVITIPDGIDTSKPMAFGIYSDPAAVEGYDTVIGWSFYLDDISIVPYEGALEDGMVDPKLLTENDAPVKEEVKEQEKEEVVVKPTVKPATPAGEVLVVSGETYSADMGITGKYNDGPKAVENPDVPGDKVIFMDVNVEGTAYNYFWYDCAYVPGHRYLVRFSAKAGNDCYGNPLVNGGKLGMNVKINGADWAQGSHTLAGSDWVSFARIVTIPEGIDTSKAMAFGIYANPVAVDGYEKPLGWDFYLDNVSVVPYEGTLEDGMVDPKLLG